MSSFLVNGCNSFYGRNFIDLVRSRGHEVIGVKHYGWGMDVDYVVNFASKSLVAESWKAPWEWARANLEDLARSIDSLACKKFIHVSTPEVYGSTPTWVSENWSFNPSTPYAVSRAAGDLLLMAYYKAYGFPVVITRTANIYGPGQQSYRLIPKALAYKREGKVFPLEGGGESIRSFIHIKDACEALYLVCEKGNVGESYHISTEKARQIKNVVELIGCEWETVQERLGKDHAYLMYSDKLRSMGWKDTISLEEGLYECESVL